MKRPKSKEATKEVAGGSDIRQLPEACLAKAISFTSPRDACRSAAVSPAFQSAADSDAVWECFLPADYDSLLSRSVDPVELSSKKELFLYLSDDPILLDDENMSFWLERSSGAKCYRMSARYLTVIWSSTPIYWRWISEPDSRFAEVVELLSVWWLDIHGRMPSKDLSSDTTYAAYMIFKFADESCGFESLTQDACVSVGNKATSKSLVSLHPPVSGAGDSSDSAIRYPQARSDGWMELELGDFYNNDRGEEDGHVSFELMEVKLDNCKIGLILEGIELRPKVI